MEVALDGVAVSTVEASIAEASTARVNTAKANIQRASTVRARASIRRSISTAKNINTPRVLIEILQATVNTNES